MAFNNGFHGDQVALNYILKTLDRKSYFVPGITVNQDISVTAAGESAYYFKRDTSSVAVGNLGDKLTYGATGVKRKTIPLTKAIQIKSVLPYSNFKTVSADVVGDRVVQESITAANKWNEEGMKIFSSTTEIAKVLAVDGAATTLTPFTKTLAADLSADNALNVILTAKKEFIEKNKGIALKPTAILASPTVIAILKEKNLLVFKDIIPGGNDSYVGYLDGMAVMECLDLVSGVSFVMVNALGLATPLNVNSLVVADSTAYGYPAGTIIAGEMGFGFEVTDANLVYVVKEKPAQQQS